MISWIKKRFDEQKYEFYENKNHRVNIFIVLKDKVIPGFYDDDLYMVYKDATSNWRIHQYKVTGQVHKFYKEVFGNGLLCSDTGKDMFKLGSFNTEPSLNRVTVDANNRNEIHCTPARRNMGELPISGTTQFKRKKDFYDFIKICKLHKEIHGNTFSLNVFTEKQFNTNV